MRIFRALLAGVLAILFTGSLAPLEFATAAAPTFYQLDNGKIRIGDSGKASVTSFGGLSGPQYHAANGSWYNLTISNIDMVTAFGVGGVGTNNWNINGSMAENPVSGVTLDTSEFVSSGARGAGVYGYGTITASGTMTLGGFQVRVDNRYTLEQTAGYLRVTTTLTNLSAGTATNVRTWVGTRDDWIGNSDSSTKERGYLSTSSFVRSAASSDRSPAIKISTASEGVLFYSTSTKANTQISNCCSFSNAYNSDPLTNATSLTNDGSYALFVRMNDLAQNASESFTWYYAAGELSTLTETINQVAQAAASWTDQTLATSVSRGNSYSDQVTASGTGTITYALVSPAGTPSAGQTSGLPSFLTLNTSSGTVTGTAPADKSADGVYLFRIRATATSGSTTATSNSPDFTITVGEVPSLGSLDLSTSVTNGIAISTMYASDAVGYPAPTYSLTGTLPAGLTFSPGSATITGIPTSQGVSTFTISATNSFGTSTSPTQTLTVNRIPSFTSAGQTILASVLKDSAYTSGVTALGWPSPTYSLKTGSLPAGINLNQATGALTGTPTVTGDYSFVFTATNSQGASDTNQISISVNKVPVVLNDVIPLTGYLASPYSSQPTFSGFPIMTYSISSGALPAGLSLSSTTGEISGTPSAAGDYTFRVRATNVVGNVDSRSYVLHINGTPVFVNTSIPGSALIGSDQTGTAVFSGYVNAYEVVSCGCVVSGSTYDQLPPGVTFDSTSGALGGSATAIGTYKFKIRAMSMNHDVYVDSPIQTIEVRSLPIWLDQTISNEVMVGDAYSDEVQALSYPSSSYSISGSLPSGTTFSTATGAITGTPTSTGDFSVTITASNAAGSISKSLTLRVYRSPYFSQLGQGVTDQVVRGNSYDDGVTASAYPAATYSLVTSNSLPNGLTLNASTGAITGTPTETGTFEFTVRATNAYGDDDTAVRTITVGSVPTVTSGLNNLTGYIEASYVGSVTVTGYPAPTFSLASGVLPAGLVLNSATGVISGTPSVAGDYSFAIRATNFASSVTTDSYSLHIYNAPVFSNSTDLANITILGQGYAGGVAFTSFVDGYQLVSCGCLTLDGSVDGLPTGLSVNSQTGAITGTTTATGTFKFKLRAFSANHAIYGDSALLTIVVREGPRFVDSELADLIELETEYSDQISATSYPSSTFSSSGSIPPGLSLDSETGELTGTPTVSGDYSFSITATNVVTSISREFNIRVSERAHFTSSGQIVLGESSLGTEYNDGVIALGYPAPTYAIDSGSLPTGLSLNASSGAITGTSTETGTFTFVVRATNEFGSAATHSRTIVIGNTPALTQNITTLVGYAGNSYSDSATFSGYPAPVYSIAGLDTLPEGLSINPATGAITGTPTEAGDFNFEVTASNFAGTATSSNYHLVIHAEPVFRTASIPATTNINSAFAGSTSFFGPVGRYNLISCQCDSNNNDETYDGLPPGFTLNSATGEISGQSAVPGTYKFVIRGWSPGDAHFSDTPVQTVEVRRLPVWADRDLNPTAPVNVSYSDFVSVTAYPAATYSAIGDLPPGLTLNTATGQISGEPTTPGIYSFSVRATNVAGTATTSEISVVVSQAPVLDEMSIAASAIRNGAFTDGISVTAYPAPTYAVATGLLPPGISLNPATGALTGQPTTLGAYSFSISIIAAGYYAYTTNNYSLNVEQAPVSTDSTITSIASMGKAYSDGIRAEAFPEARYAISSGKLPRGLSLDPATGAITGSSTETGEFGFTISATNSLGTAIFPLTLSSREAPSKPLVALSESEILGSAISGNVSVSGYPAPVFAIASGSLPNGLSLNRNTGAISGTPTEAGNFAFTVSATNDQGTAISDPINLDIVSPGANIDIAVKVGEPALGAPLTVESSGLSPNSDYTITVRSTPKVVAAGKTSRQGGLDVRANIPEDLESGWHSITLETTAADGSPLKEVTWFEVTATGILEDIKEAEPSAAEKKSALTDDNAFYEKTGIDAASQVAPETVESTVQDVASVVASVALVSAAAAATAAVAGAASAAAAAGAAGAAGAASSAGASGSLSSSGGSAGATRAPSSGSSGGSSSSGGGAARGSSSSGSAGSSSSSGANSDSGDGGDGGDYGNLEADHDDFTVENIGWGDRLALWSTPFMTFMDKISVDATEQTSKISPVFSRIINDGAYLRAIFGGVMVIPYSIAILLGGLSVNLHAASLATAGNVALLSIILILGTLDAFAGLLGILTFAGVSISVFGIHSLGDVRYLLAMTIAAFAPIILSTTFRKIRRPAVENLSDVWERIIDVFMVAFVASLATLSVVGGISSFAGATVPLAENAKNLVFVITGVAVARVLLEEFAAKAFAGRLDRINPTEVSGAGALQQWISLAFKYSVLVLMIGDMVGWGWWLWTGALIMFIPGVIGMTFQDLPKSKTLTQIIPGGLAALLLATLLSSWSGGIVGAAFKGSEMAGPLSFLLVPLPVIVVAIIGMFADGGEKWYIERKLKWVYVLGGIGVFIATVLATDFMGQIFG